MVGIQKAAARSSLALAVAASAIALVSAPGAARAAQIYGSTAIFTDRGCPTNVATCFDANGNPAGPRLTPNQFLGGYGTGFSGSAALPGGASASAEVAFGADYLPTIRDASTAGAATRTGASVSAFRSFTYTGATTIDFALTGALHYFTSGDIAGPSPANEFAGDGQLNVALALLRVSDITSQIGPNSTALDIISSTVPFEDCSSGALAALSYTSSGDAAGEHTAQLNLNQACGGGAIVLHPGDTFAVVATVQALSNRGGFLDASHTFTVQYDNVNTLDTATGQSVGAGFLQRSVTDGAAVPEPTSWALMLLGFGGLGAALRSQRRRGFAVQA